MTTLEIRRLNGAEPGFDQALRDLLDREDGPSADVRETVVDIIAQVRRQGDKALLELTRRLDAVEARSVEDLRISAERLQQSLSAIDPDLRKALEQAADRVRSYHQRQVQHSWDYVEPNGTRLGQKITPLDRVGIYVPGGKAAYPSSVLMNTIPARIAGVGEVVMTVPTPGGEVNDTVLAAAALAGVDQVFCIGGAQAVAALAYGTETIPRVDKIIGPGNAYVAVAKQLVFGQVGIDMIAGPSEVVVLCDGRANAEWAAIDLCAQAEHDERAQAILISMDADVVERVYAALKVLVPDLERAAGVRAALAAQGALIKVGDLDQAIDVVNRIAPEHLELMIDNADSVVDRIRHAGAIFIGPHSAEALGDYCAGPNHVLPTSGTARFSSPLGVYDFQKRTSLIQCSAHGADELAGTSAALARAEALTAHARSAEYRIKKPE